MRSNRPTARRPVSTIKITLRHRRVSVDWNMHLVHYSTRESLGLHNSPENKWLQMAVRFYGIDKQRYSEGPHRPSAIYFSSPPTDVLHSALLTHRRLPALRASLDACSWLVHVLILIWMTAMERPQILQILVFVSIVFGMWHAVYYEFNCCWHSPHCQAFLFLIVSVSFLNTKLSTQNNILKLWSDVTLNLQTGFQIWLISLPRPRLTQPMTLFTVLMIFQY